MKLFIEELGRGRDILIDKAVEEVICYLDCNEYVDKDLDLVITTEDGNNDMRGDEYTFYSFCIWRELYKQVPEFLVFLPDNIFIEVLFGYRLYAKAIDAELVKFSAEKAVERGISEDIIGERLKRYEPFILYTPDYIEYIGNK